MIKIGDLVTNYKARNKIDKMQKILSKLKMMEYQTFSDNEEDLLYKSDSVKELDANRLAKYVFHERLNFAINYLDVCIAFATYECGYQIDYNNKDLNQEFDHALGSLNLLTSELMNNPLGFLNIDTLYELYDIMDKVSETDYFVKGGILHIEKIISNTDEQDPSYPYYQSFLKYFTLKKDYGYNNNQTLKELCLDDYYERYSYFDGRNYGKTFKSYVEAIKDFDVNKYYELLDDKYYRVIKQELKST